MVRNPNLKYFIYLKGQFSSSFVGFIYLIAPKLKTKHHEKGNYFGCGRICSRASFL